MRTYLLDTNVLVRFLVRDESAQYNLAAGWFAEAEGGRRSISIPGLVIAESVYVLERIYKKSFTEIAEAMQGVISQRWLRVQERETMALALRFYEQGTHFVDAYLLAAQRLLDCGILTFDKKLAKQSLK